MLPTPVKGKKGQSINVDEFPSTSGIAHNGGKNPFNATSRRTVSHGE